MKIYVLVLSIEHNFNTLMRMGGMIASYDAIGFPELIVLEQDLDTYDNILIKQILEFYKRKKEKKYLISVLYPIKIENGTETEINSGNFSPILNEEIKNVFTGDELISINYIKKNLKSLQHLSNKLLSIKND